MYAFSYVDVYCFLSVIPVCRQAGVIRISSLVFATGYRLCSFHTLYGALMGL